MFHPHQPLRIRSALAWTLEVGSIQRARQIGGSSFVGLHLRSLCPWFEPCARICQSNPCNNQVCLDRRASRRAHACTSWLERWAIQRIHQSIWPWGPSDAVVRSFRLIPNCLWCLVFPSAKLWLRFEGSRDLYCRWIRGALVHRRLLASQPFSIWWASYCC